VRTFLQNRFRRRIISKELCTSFSLPLPPLLPIQHYFVIIPYLPSIGHLSILHPYIFTVNWFLTYSGLCLNFCAPEKHLTTLAFHFLFSSHSGKFCRKLLVSFLCIFYPCTPEALLRSFCYAFRGLGVARKALKVLFSITVKTEPPFWGMLYLFWVWNQNVVVTYFCHFSR